MRALTAFATATALTALGLLGVAAPASAATTWTFPDGQFFTFADAFDGSQKGNVSIQNLRIVEGGATSGYITFTTHYPRGYTCTSSTFSGTAAQFYPSSYSPCTGWLNFAVDPATGVLTATTSMTVTSLFFNGTATGTVTGTMPAPTVVPLQDCQLTLDSSAGVLDLTWTPNADAKTYDASLGGDVVLDYPGLTGSQIGFPLDVLGLNNPAPGIIHNVNVSLSAKRSDGATVATCTTNTVVLAAPGAPVIDKTVAVTQGGLVTVNYSLTSSQYVQGIEYRIDNGPWLRPGGAAPVNGRGGAFTLQGVPAKSFDLALRSISPDANGAFTEESAPTRVTFPATPTSKPSTSSNTATGSTATAPVAAPPAKPASTVSGTSNGAGTGTNGALAANTGNAGIDAPCLAKNGTLYPNLYSTVGSQLTMAPNLAGLGAADSYTVIAGALPAGVQLERSLGLIYGVPTQTGAWTTTIRARYADGSTKDSQFGTRVDADSQTLQYPPVSIGFLGTSLSIAPSTNAPAAATTYRVVCGKLPAGTTLNPRTGVIEGKPTETDFEDTAVRIAQRSATGEASASFMIVVAEDGAPTMTYPAHPHLRLGKRVVIRPSIVNVDDITTYRVWKGKLPRGLHLNKVTGNITGRVLHLGKAHTITMVAQTASGALLTSTPMRISIRR